MDTTQLNGFCARLPGAASRLLGHPSNILVYSVGDKNFAYFKTSEPERWRFSIRVNPDRFVELTDIAGIKPARYRGRYHWVTIVDVRSMPATYLAELVTWSYNQALGSLSKTRRAALTTDTPLGGLSATSVAREWWAEAHPASEKVTPS